MLFRHPAIDYGETADEKRLESHRSFSKFVSRVSLQALESVYLVRRGGGGGGEQ